MFIKISRSITQSNCYRSFNVKATNLPANFSRQFLQFWIISKIAIHESVIPCYFIYYYVLSIHSYHSSCFIETFTDKHLSVLGALVYNKSNADKSSNESVYLELDNMILRLRSKVRRLLRFVMEEGSSLRQLPDRLSVFSCPSEPIEVGNCLSLLFSR